MPTFGSSHMSVRAATVAAALIAHASLASGEPTAPSVAGTHVLARLRPGLDPAAFVASTAADAIIDRSGARSMRPVFEQPLVHRELADRLGLERWLCVDLPQGGDPTAVRAALAGFSAVFDRVELDPVLRSGLASEGDRDAEPPPLPDDPSFGLQYGMHNVGQTIGGSVGVVDADLDGPEAWATHVGAPIVVAVIDGGVDEHPELAGRILPGWNIIEDSPMTGDWCGGHGTHVAGIIAATRDDALGVAGVADRALILPVVVFAQANCLSVGMSVGEGLIWAVDHEARVVNMSLHNYVYSSFQEDACAYAHGADVLVVAIAGNNNVQVAYPGAYTGAMAVASTNNKDIKSGFSNTGPEVDLAAAGTQVYSLNVGNGYGYKNGTSMAAPHVAGTAALLRGAAPWISVDALWSILVETCDDVEAPGFDEKTGWGRVNAASALSELLARLAAGDLDANGAVGAEDLAMVLTDWGACFACATGTDCPSDLDRDCVVDGADLAIVLAAWSA